MQFTPYDKKKTTHGNGMISNKGTSIIVETASNFYMLLEKSCTQVKDNKEKYEILRHVFRRAVDQAIMDCPMAFVGFFSKVDYCIKEYGIPHAIANLIQLARKDVFPKPNSQQEVSANELSTRFPHNLKAITLFVHYVCG